MKTRHFMFSLSKRIQSMEFLKIFFSVFSQLQRDLRAPPPLTLPTVPMHQFLQLLTLFSKLVWSCRFWSHCGFVPPEMSFVNFVPSEHIPSGMNQNSAFFPPSHGASSKSSASSRTFMAFSNAKKLPAQKPVTPQGCKIVELKAKSFSSSQFSFGDV